MSSFAKGKPGITKKLNAEFNYKLEIAKQILQIFNINIYN